jgi:hypothetical protein
MKSLMLVTFAVLLVALTSGLPALAAPAHPREAARARKRLNFDDGGVVEGLNRRPLDSFNQIAEADGRGKRPHLYRKRVDFAPESRQTLHQMRYRR